MSLFIAWPCLTCSGLILLLEWWPPQKESFFYNGRSESPDWEWFSGGPVWVACSSLNCTPVVQTWVTCPSLQLGPGPGGRQGWVSPARITLSQIQSKRSDRPLPEKGGAGAGQAEATAFPLGWGWSKGPKGTHALQSALNPPFYRKGNWCLQKLSDLPKIT